MAPGRYAAQPRFRSSHARQPIRPGGWFWPHAPQRVQPNLGSPEVFVFVLASSQFLSNPFARAGQGQDMSQYGMQQMVGGDKGLQELAQAYLSKTVLTAMIIAFKD